MLRTPDRKHLASHEVLSSNEQITSGLFVSGFVPWTHETLSAGIGQRFILMLEAHCRAWDNVFVVLLTTDPRANRIREVQFVRKLIQDRLNQSVSINIMRVDSASDNAPKPIRRVVDYFRPPLPPFTLSENSLRELREFILKLQPSAIFAHRLLAFRAIRLAGMAKLSPIILDLDDIEHIAHLRSILTPPYYLTKKLGAWHCLSLFREERIATMLCKKIIVCSRLDASKMKRTFRVGSYLVSPNAIALPGNYSIDLNQKRDRNVLFVGALGYMPNLAGMQWFLDCVWPTVLKTCSDARLIIAGRGGDKLKIPNQTSRTVQVLGFVRSLDNLYKSASVAICPIFSGGGTRIKIIEAAAHGVPVVSTALGAEGLDFKDNHSILIRENPSSFSQAIVELMANEEISNHISDMASRVVLDCYERGFVIDELVSALHEEYLTC
jgi:glycosyltransferase involved in cell wall biosynthesis